MGRGNFSFWTSVLQKIATKPKNGYEREKKYYEEFLDWFVEEWNFPTDRTAPD